MLTRADLHAYQTNALQFILEKKKVALFLDMGLGKTAICLTAVADLIASGEVVRALVIAPLRVANSVWQQEAYRWEHLLGLSVIVATGSATARKKAIEYQTDITVINRENVPWLVKTTPWRWNLLIVDESSSFKSPRAKRFRALKSVIKHLNYTVLLSGTPSPNGLEDLWSQIYLLDQGERLGRTITMYRNDHFFQAGYMGYDLKIRNGSALKIKEAISDICMSMNAEDYIDVPEKISIIEHVELPTEAMAQYKKLEKAFVLLLEETTIEAQSAAILAGKLLQAANGAVYDAEGKTHIIHDCKIHALKELVEENPTENFLVAYNYKSDLARLKVAFPHAETLSKSGEEVDRWNRGEIGMMLAHPLSAGHGLNLQYGGNVVVWFGLYLGFGGLSANECAAASAKGQQRSRCAMIHLVATGQHR